MGQVAKYSGLTASYIQQLENSARGKNIRYETVKKLAKGLRVTEEDLLNFDPDNTPGQVMAVRGTGSKYGETPNDRKLRIIGAVSQLSDDQLVMLESFVDWLLERGGIQGDPPG